MEAYIIEYLARTKANYDKAYPDNEDTGDLMAPCKKYRTVVTADSPHEAWIKFMEVLRDAGWKLYDYGAIIRDGIVHSGFYVYDPADPKCGYSYSGMMEQIITEVADNATSWWRE